MSIKKALYRLVLLGLVLFPVCAFADNSYVEIDQHALSVPSSYERSITALTNYLIEPAKNDYEKVRAIYRWITNNISYDTASFFSGRSLDGSAQATFKRRSSVCQGYAELFKAMCDVAGIKCEVISGYAKGYGYKSGDEIGAGETNHAWNAVEIEGNWYLVDSTWGAGSINDSNRFEKSFSNFYFLTDPEKFIVSHFPQDPKWQLLNDQVNLSEFKMLVKPSKSFYEQGLSLVNYKEAVINADGEVEIQFKAPENLIFTGGLIRRNTRLEDKYIFFERENDLVTAKVRFPQRGTYRLNIYAKGRDEEGSYPHIIEYQIQTTVASNPIDFPKTFSNYGQAGAVLISPQAGTLQAGRSYQFKIIIPDAEEVALINGQNWQHLEKNGNEFTGVFKVGYGTNKLSAKTDSSNTFWGFVEFEAE